MVDYMAKLFFLCCFFLLYVSFSKAYIDPGTGSLVLSSIWNYVAVFFGVVGGFILLRVINPIKRHFSNSNTTKIKNHEKK